MIYGKAQNTQASKGVKDQNNAHFNWVNAIVANLAPTAPKGTYFVLNRTWRTALGRDNVNKFTLAANNRPDIIIVEPLTTAKPQWKVFAIEVSSGDQKPKDQEDKLKQEFATINNPENEIEQGDLVAVKIGKSPVIKW